MIRAFKCTRANGKDFHTNAVAYIVGNVVEQLDCDPASKGPCGRGLHVSPTAVLTCQYGQWGVDRGRWRWFEVEVDPVDVIAQDASKLRVRKLRVLREVTKQEIFGDLAPRIEAVKKSPPVTRASPG
mgnify:FL=1